MLRYDGPKHFVSGALLKRNVAALLPKHAKAGALESANEAFARNAGPVGSSYFAISTNVQKGCCEMTSESGPPQVSRYSSMASRKLARADSTSTPCDVTLSSGQRATYKSASLVIRAEKR